MKKQMEWIDGIQNAVNYIEEHITDEFEPEEIARQAYSSSFHFQKIFRILCGYSLGEYIRNRRLALAGSELSTSNVKVIDAAIKYGYDSPDSFAKAFTRFHGITPSQAKESGAKLKSFAPLHIVLTLKGGTTMDYKIVEKKAFTVAGFERKFSFDSSYENIPKFWDEVFGKYCSSCKDSFTFGEYGICIDDINDGKNFNYIIAGVYDPAAELPENSVTRDFPAATWAVFPCKGAMPKALQDLNTRIFSEWLPNCKDYEVAMECTVEMYSMGDTNSEDYYSEIWIPVKKK